MSLSDRRAEFKTALDTVSGVQGFTGRPSAPVTGDAYPVMGTATRDEASGMFAVGWSVAVWLPTDRAAADAWIDAHALEIVEALEDSGVAYVDNFGPANFGTDTNFIPGLLFTTRSE